MSRIAAVVLAAGGSSRLGQPKQLLPLGASVVLDHTLERARASSLEPRLLVVGHRSVEVLAAVDTRGFTIVHNPDYDRGQSTSVRAAVAALAEDVDAVVFLLGDQPLVAPETLDALAAARRRTGAPLVQPHYLEGRGNPVLIGRELFGELGELTGDIGARPLLQRHAEAVELVSVASGRPDDIDTIDDYERVRAAFEEQP
jgi:molybdenum cofactor cytidylyltransferase